MKKSVAYLSWTIAVVSLLFVFVHMASPRINPAQKRPERHVPGPCWLCHISSSSAPLVTE